MRRIRKLLNKADLPKIFIKLPRQPLAIVLDLVLL